MYNVLIVDDDRAIRYDLKRSSLWAKHGFVVKNEAANGHDALQKIAEEHFDLIIIDIKMPKIDGIAFLKELRAKALDICVVIASGYNTFEYARQGLVLGAFDYLLKPIESDNLDEVLKRACNHLENKYKRRNQVVKMAKQLEENIPTPISKQDELLLFKLLTEEPDKAPVFADKLTERVFDFYAHDLFKAGVLFDCLLANIWQLMFEAKPWLLNLKIVKTNNKQSLQDIPDIVKMREAFTDAVTNLSGFVKRLHLDHPDSLIKRLCEYVVENIDDKITVETAADKFGFSSSYLGKLFKQKTGEGFVYFITAVKMEKAKILIRSGKYKNYEISDILGYKSPDYFCSRFKMHTNMTPADYKKSAN
ncbi:MAG: response regulator [Pelosinus sp.]|nr:response regulator [Pelosinus sp.]